MYFDLHNHLCEWSPDAIQSFEEFTSRCEEDGLLGMAISDHYDIGSFTARGREWIFDTEEYIAQFAPYRRSAEEARKVAKPAFYIGIELGYIPSAVDRLHKIIEQDFDHCILSLHLCLGKDPCREHDTLYEAGLIPVYKAYLQELSEAVREFPDASFVAHFDYITRYCAERKSKMYYQDVSDEIDTLFRAIIDNGQPLEINTGTVQTLRIKGYRGEDAMPDPQILKRYRELGGELFVLSTDSHSLKDHYREIPETAAYLASQGITRFCYFERKKLKTYEIKI